MLRSYQSGDPYMEFCILAGAAPAGASKITHSAERKLYKSAKLALSYGQSIRGFIEKTGVSLPVAERVFRDYRRLYSRYLEWRERQVDNYGLTLQLSTKLGWTLHKGDRVKTNTPLNFPAQATGAEMLRLAVMEMTRRGVQVCCPIHDAVLIQARLSEIESAATEARDSMNAASALLLDGYVLRNDCEIFRYPDRFIDQDGKGTWEVIAAIADTLRKERTAAQACA